MKAFGYIERVVKPIFFSSEKSYFFHTCATCSELPSYISTMNFSLFKQFANRADFCDSSNLFCILPHVQKVCVHFYKMGIVKQIRQDSLDTQYAVSDLQGNFLFFGSDCYKRSDPAWTYRSGSNICRHWAITWNWSFIFVHIKKA